MLSTQFILFMLIYDVLLYIFVYVGHLTCLFDIHYNLVVRISDVSGWSPLPICECVPTTLFDTTSLGQDCLHKVVSIQDRDHITDVGSRPLTSRSHYENMWSRLRIEPATLYQTCQWEHALSYSPCYYECMTLTWAFIVCY